MASIEQIRDYIRRRIQEGVDVLYGEGGLAGEVARRFGLKTSSAGYRVWEVIRQLGGREASEKGSSKQIPLPSGEELEEGIKEREEELTKGGFALEEELERQVLQNISLVERGLSVKARQYKTEVGVADILAEDSARNLVVIELKAGEAGERALLQLLRYMGAVKRLNPSREVKGILIAHNFSDEVKIAASMIPNIKLKTYGLRIEISDTS